MIAEDSVRFAHSGPSQRFLRGLATTCLRRAPPPAHVRGWTCLRNHYYPPSFYTCHLSLQPSPQYPLHPPPSASYNLAPSSLKFCPFHHGRSRFSTLYPCIPPLSLKNRPFLHGRPPILRQFPCHTVLSLKFCSFLHGRAKQGSDRPV